MMTDAILQYALETYGTKPEYLWARYPTYAVLRRTDSRKWYAALLTVPREKLGLPGQESIAILNVKCDSRMLGSFLLEPGFLPGYHMHKGSWITVLLDGSVAQEKIRFLLDMSYDLTGKK